VRGKGRTADARPAKQAARKAQKKAQPGAELPLKQWAERELSWPVESSSVQECVRCLVHLAHAAFGEFLDDPASACVVRQAGTH
jgi:hypothetical protein